MAKYGVGSARRFELVEDGRVYDAKAVLAAAFAYEFPDESPLATTEFDGNDATVRGKLDVRIDSKISTGTGGFKMRRFLVLVVVAAAVGVPMAGGASAAQSNFVGHGCTITTCRYYTSSYHTAHYYYDRRTCSQWESLSRTYLRGFTTVTALHKSFPTRVRHPAC